MNQDKTSQSATPLTITATQVVSFAGDRPEPLYTAVATGMTGAGFQTASVYAVGDEYAEASPLLAAPIMLQSATREQCLTELILRVLGPLLSLASSDASPLVSILLPMAAEHYERAQGIDFEALRQTLSQNLPELAQAKVTLIPHHLGATAELISLRQRLAEGEAQQAILCGADSLVDALTCLSMAENGTLATQNHLDGIVPGEGAAAVLLQHQSLDPDAKQPCLGRINSLASEAEPNAGQAGERPLQGAAKALRQATAATPGLLEKATVLVGHASGVADDLEWHQLARQLWPRPLDEQQRVAMMLGEVDAPAPRERAPIQRFRLAAATGEIGAATLPMQLAIACEQFRHQAHLARFGFPEPQPLLVLENGDYPLRGALCILPPEGAA